MAIYWYFTGTFILCVFVSLLHLKNHRVIKSEHLICYISYNIYLFHEYFPKYNLTICLIKPIFLSCFNIIGKICLRISNYEMLGFSIMWIKSQRFFYRLIIRSWQIWTVNVKFIFVVALVMHGLRKQTETVTFRHRTIQVFPVFCARITCFIPNTFYKKIHTKAKQVLFCHIP